MFSVAVLSSCLTLNVTWSNTLLKFKISWLFTFNECKSIVSVAHEECIVSALLFIYSQSTVWFWFANIESFTISYFEFPLVVFSLSLSESLEPEEELES